MEKEREQLPAGVFGEWLSAMERALKTGGSIDVPCGDCTACCRSGQFVHVERDEKETLSRIPGALLFLAPGQAEGNVLMGYDEDGCCPMLVEDKCSIYAYRPRTCRSYDCRVFPATGIDAAENEKPLIAWQAKRWQFEFDDDDREVFSAIHATADFLRQHPEVFASGGHSNMTQLAVTAIKTYRVFCRLLEGNTIGGSTANDLEMVEAMAFEIRK